MADSFALNGDNSSQTIENNEVLLDEEGTWIHRYGEYEKANYTEKKYRIGIKIGVVGTSVLLSTAAALTIINSINSVHPSITGSYDGEIVQVEGHVVSYSAEIEYSIETKIYFELYQNRRKTKEDYYVLKLSDDYETDEGYSQILSGSFEGIDESFEFRLYADFSYGRTLMSKTYFRMTED